MEELRASAEARGGTLWEAIERAGENPNLSPRARTALAGFAELVRGFAAIAAKEPPSALFDAVYERTGLREQLQDGTDDGEERWTNLLELRNHAAEFDELAIPEGLERFLEEVALVSDQDELQEAPDRVTLITLHAAKGLEFPIVFIVGLEEGLLPHRRALEDDRELEEERRLAYVGMTRAKDRLYLVHANHRSTWGVGAASEPSRFLAELPEELLEADREAATPYRRAWGAQGGWQRRGTDDDEWLPGGYRSPRHRVSDNLRPVNLPDLSAPVPIGKELDAARERVSQANYEKGEELDLGHGAFAAPDAVAIADATAVAWRAGDKVRHRRFGEGIVVSSRLEKGDEWVTVAFVGQGVKELIAAYAGLERT
jgi:DNA helicase-2/ATP-dependent DNA helicase PcrA